MMEQGSITAPSTFHKIKHLQVLSGELLDSKTHSQGHPHHPLLPSRTECVSYTFIGFLRLDDDYYMGTANRVLEFDLVCRGFS